MNVQVVQLISVYSMQLIMLVATVAMLMGQQWTRAGLAAGALTISLLPAAAKRCYQVRTPPPLLLLIVLFTFCTLFLGEAIGLYRYFWWWDLALHTISGFLLGYAGFLLVHVMNGVPDTGTHMRPGFVALVAFLFSVTMGAFWEVLEYVLDIFFDLKMQTDKSGGSCGLTDSMSDLTVDGGGALVLAVMAYWHLKNKRRSAFVGRWTRQFVEMNPQLCSSGSPD